METATRLNTEQRIVRSAWVLLNTMLPSSIHVLDYITLSSNFQYFCIAPFHSVYALLYYYSLLMRTGQHPFFSGPIWGIDDHYFRSKSGPFSKVLFSCEHSGKILLLYNWGDCKNWTLMASTSAWEGPILFSSCTATPGVNLKGTHYIETFSTCRDVSI